jgi:hypothetical protein
VLARRSSDAWCVETRKIRLLQDLDANTVSTIAILATPLEPIDPGFVEILEQLEIHLVVTFIARWIAHLKHGVIET